MATEVKPVLNPRKTEPRCCGSCRLLWWQDGSAQCQRPNGPSFDTGDGTQWFFVCDRWLSSQESTGNG
jgi:hypothetical protein